MLLPASGLRLTTIVDGLAKCKSDRRERRARERRAIVQNVTPVTQRCRGDTGRGAGRSRPRFRSGAAHSGRFSDPRLATAQAPDARPVAVTAGGAGRGPGPSPGGGWAPRAGG